MSNARGVLVEGATWAGMRIVTPLGIRFRDIALEGPISNGLVVVVKAAQLESVIVPLGASPSGVFGFHGLPGLHDFEYPRSLDGPAWSAAAALLFVVMAADRLGLPADRVLASSGCRPSRALRWRIRSDPAPVLDAACLPHRPAR